jgi:hypothetical protein
MTTKTDGGRKSGTRTNGHGTKPSPRSGGTSTPRASSKRAVAGAVPPRESTLAGDPAEVVDQVFAAARFPFQRCEVDGVVGWRVEVEDPSVPTAMIGAELHRRTSRFAIYFVLGLPTPKEHRREVAIFLARANDGLVTGNYELGWDDGRLRFKTSIDFTGEGLAPAMVRNMLLHAVDATEVYDDALLSVVIGERSADEAMRDARSMRDLHRSQVAVS